MNQRAATAKHQKRLFAPQRKKSIKLAAGCPQAASVNPGKNEHQTSNLDANLIVKCLLAFVGLASLVAIVAILVGHLANNGVNDALRMFESIAKLTIVSIVSFVAGRKLSK